MSDMTEPPATMAGAAMPSQQARRIRQLNALPPVEASSAIDAGAMLRQLDELRQRILSAYPGAAVSEGQVLGSIMRKLQEPSELPGSVNDDIATGLPSPTQRQSTVLNEEMVRNIVREEVRKLAADVALPSDDVCTQGLNPGAPERRNRHEQIDRTTSPPPIPAPHDALPPPIPAPHDARHHPHHDARHHHPHDTGNSGTHLTNSLKDSHFEWGLSSMRSRGSHSHHTHVRATRSTSPDRRKGTSRETSREVSPTAPEKNEDADLRTIPEGLDVDNADNEEQVSICISLSVSLHYPRRLCACERECCLLVLLQ